MRIALIVLNRLAAPITSQPEQFRMQPMQDGLGVVARRRLLAEPSNGVLDMALPLEVQPHERWSVAHNGCADGDGLCARLWMGQCVRMSSSSMRRLSTELCRLRQRTPRVHLGAGRTMEPLKCVRTRCRTLWDMPM